MRTKTKPAVVAFPLTSIRTLYRSKHGRRKTIVFEADVKALKKVNEPNTIDEMVAEAKLEYTLGLTKTFTSAKALVKELRS
ncbi:MAG: hypothetical protein AAB633_03250 [Patescibacteria group bacterium]